eukprot:g3607.t1
MRLEDFCHTSHFDPNLENVKHTPFEAYTPCFVDAAVLGPLNLTVIAFVAWRIWYLSDEGASHLRRLTWKSRPYIRCLCAFGVFLLSLVVPVFRLSLSPQTSARASVWNAESGGVSPFEMFYFTLMIVSTGLVAYVSYFETKTYVVRGSWIMRFVFAFELCCHAVRLYHVLLVDEYRVRERQDTSSRILFGVYISYFTLLLVMFFHSVLFVPDYGHFVEDDVIVVARAYAKTLKCTSTYVDVVGRLEREFGKTKIASRSNDIKEVLLESGWAVMVESSTENDGKVRIGAVPPPSRPQTRVRSSETFFARACGWLVGTASDEDAVYRRLDEVTKKDDNAQEVNVDHVCPENDAGLLSRLLFSWMNPLLNLGHSRPLTDEDIWALHQDDRTATLRTRTGFDRFFEEERQSIDADGDDAWTWVDEDNANGTGSKRRRVRIRQRSGCCCMLWPRGILRVLYRSFGRRFFVVGTLLKLVNDAGQFAGPLFLKAIIQFVGDDDAPVWKGYVLVAAMFVTGFLSDLGEAQYFQVVMRVGFRIRSVLISKVFSKMMVLSRRAKSRSGNTGTLVNVMSSDTEAVQSLCQTSHTAWSATFRIVISMILLFNELGFSAFVGLAVLILSIPLLKLCMGFQRRYFALSKKHTDDRLKLVAETLDSAQVVKTYAWEPSFKRRIESARGSELYMLRWMNIGSALNFFAISAVPKVVSVLTFAAYVGIAGKTLTPSVAFTSMSLFNVLSRPLYMLPR